MKLIRKYRAMILYIIDIMIINISYIISAFLLVNNHIEKLQYVQLLYNTVVLSLFVYLITFNILDVYRNITRFENGIDYIKYIGLSIFSGAIVILIKFLFKAPLMGYKEIVFATILIAVAIVSYRVIIRFLLNEINPIEKERTERKNLLIIGAGEAANEIIKTVKNTMKGYYNIVGLIDDNPNKMNYAISGIKILGNRDDIAEICKQYKVDVIFFSISNIDNKNKKEILNICQETGVKIRVLPSVADIIKNKSLLQNLRDVEIEDLLGREPITLANENIGELIKGKSILVTGGGGSIGSELCRQIAKFNPSRLIIFDIYENNLYNIEMELKQNHYDEKFEIVAIVGSVRDKKRLEQVFKKYNPYLVFHAAAHKHVPLMEVSPLEAIKNNVFGTYNVANYADKYSVKRFILISTDKAVNPTNIMGATKRMCEMIIQAFNQKSKTEFAAVRFGNVLGSNGSVLPLFKKQISAGGPVTVTHKEITRFFMTIPEAVSLVLQAMSYAKGGEIFVLDMGEPVKIYDLAVSLIKLSGLEPNVDIPIEITGLRPGEKLYEELLMSEEGLQTTAHNKIFIGKPSDITYEQMLKKLGKLEEIIQDENISVNKIKDTMKQVVPTYKGPEEINLKVEKHEIENKSSLEIIKDTIEKINNTESKNIKATV
ncbi:MAG: polysaccharide biosynthesis protein [Clostridia bacterium]